MLLSCPGFTLGKRQLLSPVRLELPDEGIVVVRGPSGCGKTLLLQGLHADAVNRGYRAALQDQGARTLIGGRSVEFNIGLGSCDELVDSRLIHADGQLIHADERPILSDGQPEIPLDLPFLHKNVGEISGGERRITCLAQALADPGSRDLVFLDEPTNDLDPQSVELLKGLLGNTSERLLVVIATHDDRLASLATGTLVMCAGAVVQTQGAVRLVCRRGSNNATVEVESVEGDQRDGTLGEHCGGAEAEGCGGAEDKRRGGDGHLGDKLGETLMAEWPYFALILFMALVPLLCLSSANTDLSIHEATFQEGEVDVFSSSSLLGRDRYSQGVAVPLSALQSLMGDDSGLAWSDAVSDSSEEAGVSFRTNDGGDWAVVVADSLSRFNPEVVELVDAVTRQYYQRSDGPALFDELKEKASSNGLEPTYIALYADGIHYVDGNQQGGSDEWELLSELAATSADMQDDDLWVAASVIGNGLAQGEAIARNKMILGECLLWEALLVVLGALVHGLWLYRFRWELMLFRNLGLSPESGPLQVAARYLHLGPSMSVAVVGSLSAVLCSAVIIPEGFALGLVTALALLIALGSLQGLRLVISVLYSRRVFDWRYR